MRLLQLLVDPGVQTGQRRLDDGEDVLEIVVGAVVGVLDVEGVRTRSRVERPQHPDPVGVDAQLPQYPEVVAAQGDHQIGGQMIVVELGGRGDRSDSRARAAPCLARRSAPSPACQSPVPALVTRTRPASPRSRIWWANIFSAIGDRQMLPEQTNVTCSGSDQTPSTSRSAARSPTWAAAGDPSVKS